MRVKLIESIQRYTTIIVTPNIFGRVRCLRKDRSSEVKFYERFHSLESGQTSNDIITLLRSLDK